MPATISLTSNASVRMIDVNEDNLACAYLANLTIPIFSIENSSVVRRFEVPNQIAGIHFSEKKNHVFYAIDDSFGLHAFDTRTNAKQKFRLNPQSQNHTVIATALSNNGETIAVASAEFGGGFLNVRKTRRQLIHPHVISIYDTRKLGTPITSYYKRFKSDVTGMEFYSNGHDLLIGDQSGSIQVFDTTLHDEDNAFRWNRYTKGPIRKVGIINENHVYTISNKSEICVFDDSKGKVEVLFGAVSETSSQSIEQVSETIFKTTEWCAGLVKGVSDNLPVVAVHGVYSENLISLTPINKNGIRDAKPILSYNGHVGEVKCMKATPELLLTGGEDGNVVVQIADFRNPKFGEDAIAHHRLTIKTGDLADSSMVSHDSDEEDSSSKPSTSLVTNKPSTSLPSSSSPPAKKIKIGRSDGEDKNDDDDLFDSSESKGSKAPKGKDKKTKEGVKVGEGAGNEAKEQVKADRKKQADEAKKEDPARKQKAPIKDKHRRVKAKDTEESSSSEDEPMEEPRHHVKMNKDKKETEVKETKATRTRKRPANKSVNEHETDKKEKDSVKVGEGAGKGAREQRNAYRKKQAEEDKKEVAPRKRKAPIKTKPQLVEATDSSEPESDHEPYVSLEGYDSDFDVFDSDNGGYDFDISAYTRPIKITNLNVDSLEEWLTDTKSQVRRDMLESNHLYTQSLISINDEIEALKMVESTIQRKGEIIRHLSEHVARMSVAKIYGSIALASRQKKLMSNFTLLETTVCDHMVVLNEAKAKILQKAQTELTLDDLVEMIKEKASLEEKKVAEKAKQKQTAQEKKLPDDERKTIKEKATLKEKKVAEEAKEKQTTQEKQLLDDERKAGKPASGGFKTPKKSLKHNQQSGNKCNKDSDTEERNMPSTSAKQEKKLLDNERKASKSASGGFKTPKKSFKQNQQSGNKCNKDSDTEERNMPSTSAKQEKQLLDDERKACKPDWGGFKIPKKSLKQDQQSGNKRNKDSDTEERNMPSTSAKHSKLG